MGEALRFYSSHTAQIEVVRHDRTLEQVNIIINTVNKWGGGLASFDLWISIGRFLNNK